MATFLGFCPFYAAVPINREMAARLKNPASVVELPIGHYGAVTAPDVLAATIARA